jgi:hypothetical protein
MRLLLFVFALSLCVNSSSHAITLAQKGGSIYLTGAIKPGDHIKLRDFLLSAAPQPRVLYLHSPGGKTYEASVMARSIRAAGLITAIDGSKYCRSACPGLFAAGVKRHYFNSNGISDHQGPKTERGLGYHEGHDGGVTGKGLRYSGDATRQMINTFYEQGSPGALDFITKAPPNGMFYLSGPTALAHGLATSLSPP